MPWELISQGAESRVYKGHYLGIPAIKKVRVAKPYRHPKLDLNIRTSRTRREARLLHLAKKAFVPAPYLYYVSLKNATIIMEYLPGRLLRDILKTQGCNADPIKVLLRKAGHNLAKLHMNGIIHGDYTTSNILIHSKTNEPFIIDFGLGTVRKTNDPEVYAVELRVFSRSLELDCPNTFKQLFTIFLEGYKNFELAPKVITRYNELRLRGRYHSERRVKRKFEPHQKEI